MCFYFLIVVLSMCVCCMYVLYDELYINIEKIIGVLVSFDVGFFGYGCYCSC